jgi:hypothetical protein
MVAAILHRERDIGLVGFRIEHDAVHSADLYPGNAHVGTGRQPIDMVEGGMQHISAARADLPGVSHREHQKATGDQQHGSTSKYLDRTMPRHLCLTHQATTPHNLR